MFASGLSIFALAQMSCILVYLVAVLHEDETRPQSPIAAPLYESYLTPRQSGDMLPPFPVVLIFSSCIGAPLGFTAMHTLSLLARWEGFILLGGFVGLVCWKLVTGGISLDQLLEGDTGSSNLAPDAASGTYVSIGRAQSLTVTLFVAVYYMMLVLQNPTQFPQLPASLIALLIGSQTVYLVGKARAMLGPRLWSFLQRRMP